MMWRFSASCPGNSRCATLLLTMTTNSDSFRIGLREVMPLEKWNPQGGEVARETNRNRARRSSLPLSLVSALDCELQREGREVSSVEPRRPHGD